MRKVALVLIVVFTFAAFAYGCDKNEGHSASTVLETTDLREMSLLNVWQSAVKVTDVEESTANLDSLLLSADPNLKLQRLNCRFYGSDHEGKPNIYSFDVVVNRNGQGTLVAHWDAIDQIPDRIQPAKAFAEIDAVGLAVAANREMGAGGVNISIDYQGGDIGYGGGWNDVYELCEGKLIPLKKAVFHTNSQWATISVGQAGLATPASAVANVNVTRPNDSPRTWQIWLFSWDLAKANQIEY